MPAATLARTRDRRDLHRRHAAFAGRIPRRSQDGAAPRREALHDLMGPPINHACVSLDGRGRHGIGRNVRFFKALREVRTKRLKN